MNCFNHQTKNAVGVCKHCYKAICEECVIECEGGIACSEKCRNRVMELENQLNHNKKILKASASFHGVSAAATLIIGGIFLVIAILISITQGGFNLVYVFALTLILIGLHTRKFAVRLKMKKNKKE